MTVRTAQQSGDTGSPDRASVSKGPLVSVIVCAYNAGGLLRPAVISVLRQTYRNLEVLVVDDGSTDGCVDSIRKLEDPRLRILHQENAGKAAALNRALEEMNGEFYAIQDADDLSYPHRIERQHALFARHPELAVVLCGNDLIIDGQHMAPVFAAKPVEVCRSHIDEFRIPAHDPTAMCRVSAVRGIRYEEELAIGQGVDFLLRVGELHPMMVCGECLYSYRVNPGSATRSDAVRRAEFIHKVRSRAYGRRGIPECQLMPPMLKMAPRDLDNNIAAQFMDSVEDLRRAGRRWVAIRTGLQCMRMQPLYLHYWKALVFAMAPLWSLGFIRHTPRI